MLESGEGGHKPSTGEAQADKSVSKTTEQLISIVRVMALSTQVGFESQFEPAESGVGSFLRSARRKVTHNPQRLNDRRRHGVGHPLHTKRLRCMGRVPGETT
ncbi:MAG: hypothetical protein MRJ68_03765 [Nitrospira sp.]|nr:hypothetical protein [Nitrospira sp.]